jgi:hypothetical protein
MGVEKIQMAGVECSVDLFQRHGEVLLQEIELYK